MVAQDQIFSAAVIRLLSELIAGLERLRCGFIKSGGLYRFQGYVNFEIDEVCITMDTLHDDQGPGVDPSMELVHCDEALLNVSKADLSIFQHLTVSVRFCKWCQFRAALRFYNWYIDWTHAFPSMKGVIIDTV